VSKHHTNYEHYVNYLGERLSGIYKDMREFNISEEDLNAKSGLVAEKLKK